MKLVERFLMRTWVLWFEKKKRVTLMSLLHVFFVLIWRNLRKLIKIAFSSPSPSEKGTVLIHLIRHCSHPYFNRVWHGRHILDADSPLLSVAARKRIRLNGGFWPEDLNNPESVRNHLRVSSFYVSLWKFARFFSFMQSLIHHESSSSVVLSSSWQESLIFLLNRFKFPKDTTRMTSLLDMISHLFCIKKRGPRCLE